MNFGDFDLTRLGESDRLLVVRSMAIGRSMIQGLFKRTHCMATEVAEPMAAEQVESVDTPVTEKRGRRKAEDDPREVFVVPEEMKDDKGKIKVWKNDCDYRWGGEDDCHQPIKKELFATNEIYIDYRIGAKLYKIRLIQEEIDILLRQRDQTSSIENAASREKAKKVIRGKAMLDKLMAELASEGVDMESLLKV